MKVLVTGANGFIAKNLLVHLREKEIETVLFTHEMSMRDLASSLCGVDFVFHLAGTNRPSDEQEFATGNTELTQNLCELITVSGRSIPVLFTSSIQADLNNPYGRSKLGAENALITLEHNTKSPVYLYRLPNVFGKWSRPNYNSAVATFCHNIANNKSIKIDDPTSIIRLVYIDDVISDFLSLLDRKHKGLERRVVAPEYSVTVGDIINYIQLFKNSRESLTIETVGFGLIRALYSTYLSFLKPEQFSYPLTIHEDIRGRFVEILKTKDSGQFSFFTAHPGIKRGGHYHHSKTEKFLVVQGSARFGFRHIVTGEVYEVLTEGVRPVVVETVPGWSHDITNVGNNEMIVMIWANEVFDRQQPDTITYKD